MGKWEMVRLGDVISVSSGGTPSRTKKENWIDSTGDELIPWIKTGDLKSMFLYKSEDYITSTGLANSSAKVFPEDTVLLAMYGATIGACSILKFEASTNQACAALLPNDKFSSSFLYYYLSSIKERLISLGVGGAQPNISGTIIKSLKIPLPPLPIQQKIANTFDRINTLIEKRKGQIAKLDLLVKSQFVEMFGDPVTNPMGWEVKTLLDVTSKIGSGATPRGGKESYINEGISLVRSMNVHNGLFKYNELAHITDEQARQLDNVTLIKNDVLLNITGASVARSCIVPTDVLPARVNQHVSIIRCKIEKLNPIFTNAVLISDSYQKFLLETGDARAATRQAITKQQIKEMLFPLPPLELQNRFADFVNQADKSKFEMQQGLDKLELLYKSLMQKCFGGELF